MCKKKRCVSLESIHNTKTRQMMLVGTIKMERTQSLSEIIHMRLLLHHTSEIMIPMPAKIQDWYMEYLPIHPPPPHNNQQDTSSVSLLNVSMDIVEARNMGGANSSMMMLLGDIKHSDFSIDTRIILTLNVYQCSELFNEYTEFIKDMFYPLITTTPSLSAFIWVHFWISIYQHYMSMLKHKFY